MKRPVDTSEDFCIFASGRQNFPGNKHTTLKLRHYHYNVYEICHAKYKINGDIFASDGIAANYFAKNVLQAGLRTFQMPGVNIQEDCDFISLKKYII
jgi:hypothetical protein